MTTKTKTDVTQNALTPIQDLRNSVEKMAPQFKAALPSHVTVDKFIRTAMTAIQEGRGLLEADRTSLFSALVKAASDGLLPDNREGAIITFRLKDGTVKAQWIPMIAGILKKVRNSGELASIAPHVVYEKDEFSFWVDEKGEHLLHKPALTQDRGNIIYAYAVALTKDGSNYIEIMSIDDIELVRSKSRAKDGDAWSNWYAEMAKKTVIRRLSKRLPMSTDLEDVIRSDDELFDFDSTSEVKENSKTSSKLKALVAPEDAPQA